MQRLSNAFLTLALTVFVTAVSLILLMAAWIMAAQFLNGLTRSPLPKWLFAGLLVISVGRAATAQMIDTGALVVLEERITQSNGQVTISYSLATSTDTLPLPVRTGYRSQKRIVPPKPTWPDDLSSTEPPAEFGITGPIYGLGIQPGAPYISSEFPVSQATKTGVNTR